MARDPRAAVYGLLVGALRNGARIPRPGLGAPVNSAYTGGVGTGIYCTANDGTTLLTPNIVMPQIGGLGQTNVSDLDSVLLDVEMHPFAQEAKGSSSRPQIIVGPERPSTSVPFVGGLLNEVHAFVEIRVVCRTADTNELGYTLDGAATRDKIVESIRGTVTANVTNPDYAGNFILIRTQNAMNDTDLAAGEVPIYRSVITVELIWLEGAMLPILVNWNTIGSRPFVVVSPGGPTDGGDFGPSTQGTTTSGIQEAINSLPAGGVIYVMPGTYNVSSTITLPQAATGSLHLQGSGIGTTIINFTGTGKAISMVGSPQASEIGGFTLTGTTGTIAIYWEAGSEWFAHEIRINGTWSTDGIQCNGDVASDLERLLWRNIHNTSTTTFGTVSSGQLTNLITFENCTLDGKITLGPTTAGGTVYNFIGCNMGAGVTGSGNASMLIYANNVNFYGCANEASTTIMNIGGGGTAGAPRVTCLFCDWIPASNVGFGNLGLFANGNDSIGQFGQSGTFQVLKVINCRGQTFTVNNTANQFVQPSPSGSPFSYQNTGIAGSDALAYITGGTVTAIAIKRFIGGVQTSQTLFSGTNVTNVSVRLMLNDVLVLTYSSAPTLTVVTDG